MAILSIIVAAIATIGFLLSLIPYLDWLNIVSIPLALLGAIFGAIGMSIGLMRGTAVAGFIWNLVILIFGGYRLFT